MTKSNRKKRQAPKADTRHLLSARIARLEQEIEAYKQHIVVLHSILVGTSHILANCHVDHVDAVSGEVIKRNVLTLIPQGEDSTKVPYQDDEQ